MSTTLRSWPGTIPGGPHEWTDADLRVGDHGLRRFLAANPAVTIPPLLRQALVDYVAGAVLDRVCGGEDVHAEDVADLAPMDDAGDDDPDEPWPDVPTARESDTAARAWAASRLREPGL